MYYKTILVHLTDPRRAENVLEPALALARRCGSHVIGLYVYPSVPAPPIPVPGSGQVMGAAVGALREESEQLASTFSRMAASHSCTSEWRSLKAQGFDLGGIVVDHGRCSDLVVAGQTNPEWELAPAVEFPERLAMECGRPVLVVPHAGRFPEFGRNVLIAWKPTREAARAIFDALPLLSAAEKVQLLEVRDVPAPAGRPKPDIVVALERHGINAAFGSIVAADASVGAELLSHAAREGADLVVMGAYGRPRMLQFVLGGVTRHVARHMTVPTIWSH
jgi:nucleotide-binding universal stress UspA family protein